MSKRSRVKLIHEGEYVAEVDVDLMDADQDWAPYLSLEDAYKLDDVRAALRRKDLVVATRLARVYTLTPVTAGDRGNSGTGNVRNTVESVNLTVYAPVSGSKIERAIVSYRELVEGILAAFYWALPPR